MKTIKLYILISLALITACSSTQEDKLSFSNIGYIDFIIDGEELDFYKEEDAHIEIFTTDLNNYYSYYIPKFNNAIFLPNFVENKNYKVCITYNSKIHDNFKVCFDSINLSKYGRKWKLEVDNSPSDNKKVPEMKKDSVKSVYFLSFPFGNQFIHEYTEYEY